MHDLSKSSQNIIIINERFLSFQKHVELWRMFLLLGAATFAAYASVVVGCPGGGAFACLILGFVTGLKWKKEGIWKSDSVSLLRYIWKSGIFPAFSSFCKVIN